MAFELKRLDNKWRVCLMILIVFLIWTVMTVITYFLGEFWAMLFEDEEFAKGIVFLGGMAVGTIIAPFIGAKLALVRSIFVYRFFVILQVLIYVILGIYFYFTPLSGEEIFFCAYGLCACFIAWRLNPNRGSLSEELQRTMTI